MKKKDMRYSLFSIKGYINFFLLTLFIGATNLSLYNNILQKYGDDSSQLRVQVLIIANLLFISLIMTLVDSIRRKFTMELPIRRIVDALGLISKGKFETRIEPLHTLRVNEFDEIIDGINKMAEELIHVETLKSDFISNVSHELKTPLAIVQSYAAMLQKSQLTDEEKEEYAKAIADAARRLSGLVTNILKLNKLENQDIYPEQNNYNIGEQLRNTLIAFEGVWSAKELEIEAEIEDVNVVGDENLLEIVWSNLISNAIKFSNPGGLIRISLKQERNAIVVTVADTGCGMDETTGKHIFDKFYQGDTSHAKEGNGLGLAMVKRVVDIINGDISVESRLGIGTTFTVRINN